MTLFNPLTAIAKDPTGWDDPTLVSQSYESSTRVVTVTGTGKLYWQGRLVHDLAISSLVSAAHTATVGSWYWYYDGSAYVWSMTAWTFDLAQLCAVSYQTAAKFALRECHSMMDSRTHRELHLSLGTLRLSGGDLSAIVLASTTVANRRPAVAATVLLDEDLETTNPLLAAGSYTQLYIGAASAATFVTAADDIVPLNVAIPKYNNVATGQLIDLLVNQYMNVWLVAMPVTSDAGSQVYRYLWVTGQAVSTTRATIDAETPNGVNLGTLTSMSAEFVFLSRLLIRYATGNWTIISNTTLTGSRFQQVGAVGSFLSSVATDSTLTGVGTAADPLHVVGYGTEYYEAVGSVTGTGSVQDLVNIDGETYPWVELEMFCASHPSATATRLWCNADTTEANYNSQMWYGNYGTTGSAVQSINFATGGLGGAFIASSDAENAAMKVGLTMYVKANSGNRLATVYFTRHASTTSRVQKQDRSSNWTAASTAVTKFSATIPSGVVWKYKLVARKGA